MGGGNISLAADMINNKDDDGDQSLQPWPLASSYNDVIRPLCDSLHKLRCMNVIEEEGITLPTIVVIGDQSSGKSSVIESLTGIRLQGLCIRVPLIIRLRSIISDNVSIRLKFDGKTIARFDDETKILEEIDRAIVNIKEISYLPLTLIVRRKNTVPGFTIIDLPGIAVNSQSDNINSKISEIVTEYIKPSDSIILNVISATTDFMTCESIRMANKFDKSGQRTLHVFTKVDELASKDLYTIVSTKMGPDYICVRNRLSGETYEDSRTKESNLFETHHNLSKIEKSLVGIHVLAQKLALIQLANISETLREIVKKINEDLNTCALEQNKLDQHYFTTTEAMSVFMQIIKMSRRSLYKMVVSSEFDEYPHDTELYFFPRFLEMLSEFSLQLEEKQVNQNKDFFIDEVLLLLEEEEEESEGSVSTSYDNQKRVLQLLAQTNIDNIFDISESFVSRVWGYIEVVIVKVLVKHAQSYPQPYLAAVKMAANNVIAKMKESFKLKVLEHLEKKKTKTYLVFSGTFWDEIKESFHEPKSLIENELNKLIDAKRLRTVFVRHIVGFSDKIADVALLIRKNLLLQWRIFVRDYIDWMESQIRGTMYMIAYKEMESELVKELKGGDEDSYVKKMEIPSSLKTNKWKLKNRTELLENSKKVIENVMDKIV